MHLLFDLDGTLTDPSEGIGRCIHHAFAQLQLPPPAAADLPGWIGPPLYDSFLAAVGCPERAQQAVQWYRDRFAAVGLYENCLYDGIPELLAALHQQGHTLWVSTSKPQIFAQKIIHHFGLTPFLAKVYGSELNGDRAHKAELIAHLLATEGIPAAAAVMVGDRHYDIHGARHNGMRAIGVTWGFGSATELQAAGADALCDAPTRFLAVLHTLGSPSANRGE